MAEFLSGPIPHQVRLENCLKMASAYRSVELLVANLYIIGKQAGSKVARLPKVKWDFIPLLGLTEGIITACHLTFAGPKDKRQIKT